MKLLEYELVFAATVFPIGLADVWLVRQSEKHEDLAKHGDGSSRHAT
ncbi:hypothetical protein I8J34_03475 [Denitromonas sp. IR12]|uniref:Uncharacterized protein n=1 Tax=Denitromonas iodatirespirans TaxID=2795389 RepID=A0A944D814_DENI1|nr:hypothetical protein [Denitromonas iodatirespirans]